MISHPILGCVRAMAESNGVRAGSKFRHSIGYAEKQESCHMNDSHLGYASTAAVRQYLRLADALDLAQETLLETSGITADQLADDSGRIRGEQFQALIHAMVTQSEHPVLGLLSGDYVQPGSYTVLGYITMSCATLGEAVARITPFEKLVGDMGVTRVSSKGDNIQLTWHCNYTDPLVRPHMVDNVFASWINYARWLANRDDASPLEILLEHASPGARWEREYEKRWQCPVRFAQPSNTIVAPRTLLSVPLRQPDPILRRTLEEHALNQIAALDEDSSLAARVRHTIHQQLRQGVTRQDMIAEQLEMTARTLQRRLSQEGLSYQVLLDEVRHDMARDYLTRTTLPIPDIAMRLGFSEPRSFHRSFKHWSGMTPGEFRKVGE